MKLVCMVFALAFFTPPIWVVAQDEGQPHLIATLHGDTLGDYFCTVCSVGDVNGDGYGDLLVGARGGGYVRLYLGGPSFDTTAAMVFHGSGSFGATLAGGADFNGDGYTDFAIGAPNYWEGFYTGGAVYVYYGGPALDTIPDWQVMPAGDYAESGVSLSFAKDLNGDGYTDLAIGSRNDPNMSGRGRLYIYYGGPSPDTLVDQTVDGTLDFDFFSNAVASVGDLNGDGVTDLVVGAPQSLTFQDYGRAYLLYGSTEMHLDTTLLCEPDTLPGNDFGRTVVALGDINGDSHPDFAVLGLRETRIYFGATVFGDIQVTTITTDLPTKGGFTAIVGGVDLTGDEKADVLVGNELVQGNWWGAVRCLPGGDPFRDTTAFHLEGPHENNNFGVSLAIIPNLTGKTCIAVGDAQWESTRGPGQVYIYELGPTDDIYEVRRQGTPRHLKLDQNYPNPFNSSTNIRYHLAERAFVHYEVYNVLGQRLASRTEGLQEEGDHVICFEGEGLASGLYIVRVVSGKEIAHITMTLIK